MSHDNTLVFVPKMHFPRSVFAGEKSLLYLKTINTSPKIVIVSKTFKENNEDLFAKNFIDSTSCILHTGEPTVQDVECIKKEVILHNAKHIIGIGGGSVIDLVKIIKKDIGLTMIAIPTTVGSGAELSQYSVIINGDKKEIYSSPELLPEIVLYNPAYVLSLKDDEIIFQAIDALSHGLEALVSRFANQLSDKFALMGIESLYENLSRRISGENRQKVIIGIQSSAFYTGLAQSSAAAGLTHSFAHYFGVKNKIPHARAVATFLLDVLKLNIVHSGAYAKINVLKSISADTFIGILEKFMEELNVTQSKIVLTETIEKVAEDIRKDISSTSNPYAASKEDIIAILNKHV